MSMLVHSGPALPWVGGEGRSHYSCMGVAGWMVLSLPSPETQAAMEGKLECGLMDTMIFDVILDVIQDYQIFY